MNKKLGLAVAGAVLALSSAAQAGITIPAGDWTVDIGGNVNAFYTTTRHTGDTTGWSSWSGANGNGEKNAVNVTTGLLPNYLAVSGKTRQNDLDVSFTISINPGASTSSSGFQGAQQENRQAFLTFGDASWGSIKLGKDLGVYASDAILNDMTLLGVGGGAGVLSAAGNTTTVGRIGSGYQYADWKAQAMYTSPNWNGFQFTAGVSQPWNATTTGLATVTNSPLADGNSATTTGQAGSAPAFEGKVSYSWAGDVSGKVWMSAISQRLKNVYYDGDALGNARANAWDIGANVNAGAFGFTGYYGSGRGIGHVMQFRDALDPTGKRRDSNNWYTQATYVLPTGTKLGLAYGESELEGNTSNEDLRNTTNKMWTVGAYHPITKSLNLVAEYSDAQTKTNYELADDLKGKAKTVSLGAILFF